MKLIDLHEGIFDFLKKKQPQEKKNLPLTEEQRDMIRKHFTSSNVDIKLDGKRYALEYNVLAKYKRGQIYFRNEDGVLKASVGYYGSEREAQDSKAIPVIHLDRTIKNDADMKDLKAELEPGGKVRNI